MTGEQFLEWVDEHREEIKKAKGLFLHGSDAGMQQLGDVEISDCAYSSETFGNEYDDDGNVTRWCEYGECSKGDIIFDSY